VAEASAARVEQGGSFTVTVTGLTADEQVTAVLHSQPLVISGIPAAGPDGSVTFRVNVPSDFSTGAHTLILARGSGTEFAQLAVQIVPSAGLAVTGSNVSLGLGLGAGMLVLAGAVLLWYRRRVRRD
jgi:hypothetical protein